MRRAKWLTHALIISATLNVGLSATFVYFVLKEKQRVLGVEPMTKPSLQKLPHTNEGVLRSYAHLSFPQLLMLLNDKELVEEGYYRRDLALASLVAFHHFNLERALGGLNLQQRAMSFSVKEGQEKRLITLFPGLTDYQYQAIIQYAKTEKWPFTSQGLFSLLQRSKGQKDPSLLEAFYLTPEFHAVATLLSRSGLSLTQEESVDLLLSGDWKILEEFVRQQQQDPDFSLERCRSLLGSYLGYRSGLAAKLLFSLEKEMAVKTLDDAQILLLLELLEPVDKKKLAQALIVSGRSDTIWKKAAATLYALAGETLPEPYDHKEVVRRFAPERLSPLEKPPSLPKSGAAKPAAQPESKRGGRTHVVQKGDTLWKIARRYEVSVEDLMRCNRLDSERLQVGKQLEIPEKKS